MNNPHEAEPIDKIDRKSSPPYLLKLAWIEFLTSRGRNVNRRDAIATFFKALAELPDYSGYDAIEIKPGKYINREPNTSPKNRLGHTQLNEILRQVTGV